MLIEDAATKLQELRSVNESMNQLAQRKAELEKEIEEYVVANGDVMAHGLVAKMKKGRDSKEHERAAQEHGATEDLIAQFTTVTPSIAWAKITAKMKIDMKPYTTDGKKSFVIEQIW